MSGRVARWFDYRGGVIEAPWTDGRPTAWGTYDRRTHAMFGHQSEVALIQALTLCGRRVHEVPGHGAVDCTACLNALAEAARATEEGDGMSGELRHCECGREEPGVERTPCAWAGVRSVPVEFLREQAAAHWPDLHPEHFCLRCGNRNLPSWFAPSEIWNEAWAVVEPGIQSVLCPQCFDELWEKATGIRMSWEIRPDIGVVMAKLKRARPDMPGRPKKETG